MATPNTHQPGGQQHNPEATTRARRLATNHIGPEANELSSEAPNHTNPEVTHGENQPPGGRDPPTAATAANYRARHADSKYSEMPNREREGAIKNKTVVRSTITDKTPAPHTR